MSQATSVISNPSAGLVDKFGDGLVVNYQASFFTPPAALANQTQSQWYIAQWGQAIPINSADYTQNNPATYDPVYGNATYSWTAPGATSAITYYQNTNALGGGTVYDLTDGNTNQAPQVGLTDEADMFLAAATPTPVSLSNPVTISLNAKLAQSNIAFATPQLAAQYAKSGVVFGTFDIGLTINFSAMDGLPAYSGYVQIVPWTSDSPALANYESGPVSTTDPSQFVSSTLVAGDPSLSLISADAGANPDTLTYNVNQYVYNTLVSAFVNFSPSQKAILLNMANWTIGGVYVGPATNDAQVTSAAGVTSFVANEAVGIQVSNISLTSNPNATYNPNAPVAVAPEVDTNPQMTFYDNTITAPGTVDGSVYSGPLTGIQDKYIYTGADSIDLAAPAGKNWEFGGGSGLTGLSAVSGNNIFVASTGSSFMIGGTGQDIFDVPNANLTGIGTWDTIKNFHTGDTISLAGIAGPGWTYCWVDGVGATGNTGLTLVATSTTTPGLNELVTLSGLSMGDLSSLSLTPDASGDGGLTITRIAPQISSYNLATGVSGDESGTNVSNIAGINAEYIYTGSQVMSFVSPAGENWEFGGGSAFTELAAFSGNNIFIASTGSSYMLGGTGNDTFEIPDANLTGTATWDTITNFHHGDSISLAGLAGAGWTYSWSAGFAAVGSPGLTLEATSKTTPGLSEFVTLGGLNMSNLASLTVAPGTGTNAANLIVSM